MNPKLQVLVSTLNSDEKLIKKMNIDSYAIIINQTDKFDYKEINHKGSNIKYFSLKERGIGKSRNYALAQSNSNIIMFADDDIVYTNNYEKIVLNEFKKNPKADIIVFNLPSKNPKRVSPNNSKIKRVRFYNCLRYPVIRLAIKTDKIKYNNIHFSLLFGGGTKYGCGEDTIFIVDCLKKGLKIYTSPVSIGTVSHKESTWFKGYNEKYFKDRGALFYMVSHKFSKLLCIQYILRHKEVCEDIIRLKALKLMFKGIKEYKSNLK